MGPRQEGPDPTIVIGADISRAHYATVDAASLLWLKIFGEDYLAEMVDGEMYAWGIGVPVLVVGSGYVVYYGVTRVMVGGKWVAVGYYRETVYYRVVGWPEWRYRYGDTVHTSLTSWFPLIRILLTTRARCKDNGRPCEVSLESVAGTRLISPT